MVRCGQIVIGPAGSGKSSYCNAIKEVCADSRRRAYIVNLDPAAEQLPYDCDLDIRDLISLDDAVDAMKLGPNGGLVFCIEYLRENMEWLEDELSQFDEDGYFVFDCPGQIELFTHFSFLGDITTRLTEFGFRLISVYLMDCPFISDESKYLSGSLMALSSMLQLGLPHLNLLTKCDLVTQDTLDKYRFPDGDSLLYRLKQKDPSNNDVYSKLKESPYTGLSEAISSLLDDFGMVSYIECSIRDEELLNRVLLETDSLLQYGEDLDIEDHIDENEQVD
ncbi:hypothetical protein JH06_5129 [Blastocystis sp. subtype 4]|uniref:hypothetical protein n=1 Tax=Blastocystis sp. subtype 4 TaxID=944170 RepID=UPI0007118098|nr:hypothetical protein JH06_5129 [Blastocystis sp. subtype 4]KNB41481.1 hypothetical protein JH06_5129 [Blastocystis sp. subtype 4]|eukprot:XP_014524924.1 hypothetical protein JH06_5129 [Blastocystis sp. subtype 4]